MISIVSPVYNSQEILEKFVEKIVFYSSKVVRKFEIILVDDGSKDSSWNKIIKLKKRYNFIKGIKLNKNYGQHQAIYQGIKSSTKKLIIILDCDLEDNPAYIIDMFRLYCKKKKPIIIKHYYKNFKLIKRIISHIFWYFLSVISLKKFSPYLGNYILIDYKIKKKYLSSFKFYYLYGDLIMQGNNFIYINKKKARGIRINTTYTLAKLITLAFRLIIRFNIFSIYFFKFYKNNMKNINIIVEKRI